MRNQRRGCGRQHSRGQALVEFALVFPLIVFVLLAIFDAGRAVYTYNTVANAARQGARIAAVNQAVTTNTDCHEDMPVEDPSSPDWSIKACAAQAAVSLGVQVTDVTVAYAAPASNPSLSCPSPPAGLKLNVGCIATVTVRHTWTAITPVIGTLMGSINMSATSQMPVERVFP
jgi:Flp pilus assembly protein TadG